MSWTINENKIFMHCEEEYLSIHGENSETHDNALRAPRTARMKKHKCEITQTQADPCVLKVGLLVPL